MKRYIIEVGEGRVDWGSVYPGDKKLHKKKGSRPCVGINKKDSKIKKLIVELPPGESPLVYLRKCQVAERSKAADC